MLGVLCARQKPWILNSISLLAHSSSAALQNRFVYTPIQHVQFGELNNRRRRHSSACSVGVGLSSSGGAASIWHAILPSGGGGGCECRRRRDERKPGEGSWNAAWDERPARWLHRADSAWLLFGVCSCLAPIDRWADANPEAIAVVEEKTKSDDLNEKSSDFTERNEGPSTDFKVTG